MRTNNIRNMYRGGNFRRSRYQLGGPGGLKNVPTNLSDPTLPLREREQSGLATIKPNMPTAAQTIMQLRARGNARKNRDLHQAARMDQRQVQEQRNIQNQRNMSMQRGPIASPAPPASFKEENISQSPQSNVKIGAHKRPYIGGYKDPKSGQTGYWFTDKGEFLSDADLEGVENIGTDPRFKTNTKWWEEYDKSTGKLIRPGLNVLPPGSEYDHLRRFGGTRKYQVGGMYDDNTAAALGQGAGPQSTANIVYQESDPNLQAQREKQLQESLRQAEIQGAETQAESERLIEQGKFDAEQDAAQAYAGVQQKAGALEALATTPYATQMAAGKSSAISAMKAAYQGQRFINVGTKLEKAKAALDAAKAAGDVAKAAELTTKVANLADKTTQIGSKIGDAAAISKATAGVTGKGSALMAGAKSFLSSGAGLGLAASGLGYGVKKLWADDDPTTADIGEVGGSALSGAGTGMALGSVVPGIGTAIGGIIGGLWGAGKSIFGAAKARREKRRREREYKRKVKKAVDKHNKQILGDFGTSLARARSGATQQKVYSGYDLGQNVVAQMGGMRLGMPRYSV